MTRINWLEVPILPLRWIERTTGRWRLALLGLYALIAVVGGALIGRETILWEIPASPEPFDLAVHGQVDLADADNALVGYRAATAMVAPKPELGAKVVGDQWAWGSAVPEVRAWAEANRQATTAWREASRRPDLLFIQPADYHISTILTPLADLRQLAQLGTLEATERQSGGDLAGAWVDFRAVLRTSVHVGRHGGVMPSVLGANFLRQAKPSIWDWIDDRRQTPELLRAASLDLAWCRRNRATLAEIIRTEYFANRAALAEPSRWREWGIAPEDRLDWLPHLAGYVPIKRYLWNEPKRSLKIFRLLTAGHLAQAERPAASRPRVVGSRYLIYALDPTTPAPLRRIKPEVLTSWADDSGCRGVLGDHDFNLGFVGGFANSLDALHLHAAERLYALDHGGRVAGTYGDLIKGYLDALPEGIAPGDPIP